MLPNFEKAFKDMAELGGGSIANPDERRMVGHYWLWKPELAPTIYLQKLISDALDKVEGFAEDVMSRRIKPPPTQGRFTQVLSVGIGDSSLGPQFVAEALAPDNPPLKSGGTPETRNGLLEVQKAFREVGLDFAKQGVAITQENTLLDNTAKIEGWLPRFPMFDWAGGRTSEMSAVELLPAALQGTDIRGMLEGLPLWIKALETNR